jgi:hypothetical protein
LKTCQIYVRHPSPYHSQNYLELAKILRSGGWLVTITASPPARGPGVVVAVNAPAAIRAAAMCAKSRAAVVFYALEVDLPRVGTGSWSTIILPWARFDGLIATSARRLALLSTMIRADTRLVLENKLVDGDMIDHVERERAAVYTGSLYETEPLSALVAACAVASIPVDVISYDDPARAAKLGVRRVDRIDGPRSAVIARLARYQFGLLPERIGHAASTLDFLYTPNKLYDYLAAGLVVVSNLHDPDTSVRPHILTPAAAFTLDDTAPRPPERRGSFAPEEIELTLAFFGALEPAR